ncbi:tRNA epoxyqueuosine(34) reductase QueG [Motilimonas cestriensis]|uniref:Epoxyqueuosine reductase n=1 Tax=Motilimonas cestriensis TaxID=2742685 RepID=A0ABS8WBP3_9GAMM|nr:tRNA epoxyqueuosine(34) reductase QueG [Motilimonas cestriensis]MCE2595161.1 tRNA epoxyqueuosine(34) reductase QueG [Motilimonas cestriensis]
MTEQALEKLANNIKKWGQELGFQQVGIADIDLSEHEAELQQWLDSNYHGAMDYMSRHGMMRARPDELHPGALRVISVRMDYLPPDASFANDLKHTEVGYISRYALGRDYHKVMRQRLKQLGEQIKQSCSELDYRPFVDSAPILERPLAANAGLGWVGKHSLVLDEQAGSWFFLGELLVNLPLPVDQPITEKCGSCVACITICPTQAIVEPYVVDARRCISYLTIELNGPIPEEFRPLIGNRIYGCDDCQLICPWNRYAKLTDEADFHPRTQLKSQQLLTLFNWTEAEFLQRTEGSPIRRIGFERWQRNIAVALGNASYRAEVTEALEQALASATSDLVKEHILWALTQQQQKSDLMSAKKTQRLIRSIEKGLPRDA